MTDYQILERAKQKIESMSPEKLQHEFIQVPVEWEDSTTVYWAVVTFKKHIENDKIVWREHSTFKS